VTPPPPDPPPPPSVPQAPKTKKGTTTLKGSLSFRKVPLTPLAPGGASGGRLTASFSVTLGAVEAATGERRGGGGRQRAVVSFNGPNRTRATCSPANHSPC
jgi:hypothetical protein